MKKFPFFSLSRPWTLVFIFPYIVFSPTWRPGGRRYPEEHCLTLLAAAHWLSSDFLRAALLWDMFQSPGESKRQQHEGKGTQIQEGKAAWNTVNGAGPQGLYTARSPLILMGTSGQRAQRVREEGWRCGEVRHL